MDSQKRSRSAMHLVVATVGAVVAVSGCTARAPIVRPAEIAPPPAAAAPPPAAPVESFDKSYFDYNRASLRPEAKRKLTQAVDELLAHPDWRVNVEGYCDERGTDAYNMALGWKRAYAVRDFLERLGVDDRRLFPISYGRARPAAVGDTERAWSLNRRVELTPRT